MPLGLSGTSGVLDNSGAFIAGTAVASTSGTSITFTSIPSWVKRVTVMFDNVTFGSADRLQVQLVTSGGVVSTGYNAGCWLSNSTNVISTTAFPIVGFAYSGVGFSGNCTVCLLNSNTWSENSILSTAFGAGYNTISAGSVSLGSTLTGVRISGVGGATFSAGSINILYE
jgi:hypothetical protein